MDISEDAYLWVRKNEKSIVDKFIGNAQSVEEPESFFMAGSPGAGKTEYSKLFIKDLNTVFQSKFGKDYPIVRIDADDIRQVLPGYNGSNSSLFQRASVLAVNKLHDYVLKKKINFLLDGTFADHKYAIDDINRSVEKGRKIQISYLYQDPIHAWELTRIREMKEGRVVPMDVFIRDYFSAKEVVNEIKLMFAEKIRVDLVIRDYIGNESKIYFNISSVDSYLKIPYDRQTLEARLLEINSKLNSCEKV